MWRETYCAKHLLHYLRDHTYRGLQPALFDRYLWSMPRSKNFSTRWFTEQAKSLTFAFTRPSKRIMSLQLCMDELVHLKRGEPVSKHCQSYAAKPGKGHGWIEKEPCWSALNLTPVSIGLTWHDQGRRKTREIVYGLTSLTASQANPIRLLELLRGYWGIENGLHRRRDVTLHEYATWATVGFSALNLAILNNLTVAIAYSNGYRNLAKAFRFFNAHLEITLALICRA